MATTGLIYLAIAALWLAYLIPMWLKRREDDAAEADVDPNDHFSDSVRIIRSGAAPLLDQDLGRMDVEISTPMTRRAAITELRRSEERAAGRRRRVLVALMIAVTAVLVLCVAELIPWWSMAFPAVLVLAFVGVARFSVAAMRRDFDARYQRITQGSDESTVFLSRKTVAAAVAGKTAKAGTPSRTPGGLWEPLPITLPTYVSKPLAPRTVRTIDLSAPDVTSAGRLGVPVTADPPVAQPEAPVAEPGRAVGE